METKKGTNILVPFRYTTDLAIVYGSRLFNSHYIYVLIRCRCSQKTLFISVYHNNKYQQKFCEIKINLIFVKNLTMPYVDIDIEIYEFVRSCSKSEIKELIEELVENDHLPKDVINKKGDVKKEMSRKTNSELEFSDKLDKLKEKYFSLSQEEELSLNNIFNKHL